MRDRLEQAKITLHQAIMAKQSFMAGAGGASIKSYRDGYDRLRELVLQNGYERSPERLFDSDVRKGYEWLWKLQLETAPARKKARELDTAVKSAKAHLKTVERELGL